MQNPPEDSAILIQHSRIVDPVRITQADLRIRNGRIAEIAPQLQPQEGEIVISGQGKYLLPGFIDIHNHGAMGFDASLGRYDKDQNDFDLDQPAYQAGLESALSSYVGQGITRVLLTTLAAPTESLQQAFRQIAQVGADESNLLRHVIAGINLEGTFIKDPAYAGAQNPAYFCPLDQELFASLQAASGDQIRIVNLPPEHGPEGCAFTRYLTGQGIIVAGGHSAATAHEFDAAVDAGLRLGVHFLNGPSMSSSKPFHGGGTVQSMLYRDEVKLELIVDGYHVAPAYVRDVIARKGPERIVLITDSVFVNGCSDIERFSLSGIPGQVSDNGQYLQVRNKPNSLFGSVLRMERGFSNVLSWLTREMSGIWTRQHDALSLDGALLISSKMASAQPAQLLGMYAYPNQDRVGTGSIEIGKWADLVLMDIKETEEGYACKPIKTFVKGFDI